MTDISSLDHAGVTTRPELKQVAERRPVQRRLLQLTPRDLLVMTFFWVLLYIEPMPLGPLKISELWKAGVVVSLSMLLIRRHLPVWFLVALLFAAKCLIYISVPYGIIDNISFLMEFYFFPALLLYYLRITPRHFDWADRMILLTLKIALFFVFSAAPFVLGIESLYPARDLAMWGEDARAITSFFASLSPASKIFYTAALMLIAGHPWFPRNTRYQLLYWSGVLLGTYLVYGAFTRTGWFIYAGGIVLIVLFQRGALRKMIAFTLLGLALIAASKYLLQNEAFLLRMAGGAVGYREDVQVGLAPILQARVPFIFTSIDNLNENGLPAWLLGHGVTTGTDLFRVKTGMAITAHNGTFNTLEATGLIGLTLYLIFCALLGRALLTAYRLDPQGRAFYLITAYIWVATFLISHGLPFYAQTMAIGPLVRAFLVVRNRNVTTRDSR